MSYRGLFYFTCSLFVLVLLPWLVQGMIMMLVVISLHLVPTALYNILQKKVREYTEGVDTDLQVVNENIGVLEDG